MVGYHEHQNYLQLSTTRGWWFLSRAQSTGAIGGLLVGLLFDVRLQPTPWLVIALPLVLVVAGVVLGTRPHGVMVWQQMVFILRYAVRRLLHAEQRVAALQGEPPTAPAFYCEEVAGERTVWSYWQPHGTEA